MAYFAGNHVAFADKESREWGTRRRVTMAGVCQAANVHAPFSLHSFASAGRRSPSPFMPGFEDPSHSFGYHAYLPQEMLLEVQQPYPCPILLSENAVEEAVPLCWLSHVDAEIRKATELGVEAQNIYPHRIHVGHGWENDHLCRVGSLSMPDSDEDRYVDVELAKEYKPRICSTGRRSVLRYAALVAR